MANPEVLRVFLEKAAEDLKKAIVEALDADPTINKIIADLRSLGVVTVIDQALSVRCFAARSFVPPVGLDHLSKEKLNDIISDQEFAKFFGTKSND